MSDSSISLNKFISATGICSRREADRWIEAGRVKINGQVAKRGNRVEQGDQVTLDDKPLQTKAALVYIALNKPPGITCTTELHDPKNIIDFVQHPQRIFPIGRLDKPSTGLILLTNDGDIVNRILREENEHDKEYIVRVNRPITKDFIAKMQAGIAILDTITKPCKVEQLGKSLFKITLTQGLNRQIRRMCEALDYKVATLKRVRIMNIRLGKLPVGEWRDLTPRELTTLKDSL
ncbi:MAG: 23S rRNA pseudouridine(2604) synthase RluF [Aureispira sp.]